MQLNEYGRIVDACWRAIPEHFPHVCIDEFVVMPDHVHGIIRITRKHERSRPVGYPPRGPSPGSLGAIIGSLKSAASRRINRLRSATRPQIWQRNYWDRLVRSPSHLHAMRLYIRLNPANWSRRSRRSVTWTSGNTRRAAAEGWDG